MSNVPIYDSAALPPPEIAELIEAVKYRQMILQFVRRDIMTRYKRSMLGVLWTMLNPLGTMAVIVLVFAQLFHNTSFYPVYCLSGLVTWSFFAQVTSAAPQTLLWSGPLIHRIYVPRTAFALTALGAGLVNLLLSLVPLGLAMAVFRVPFRISLLILPLSILLLSLFSLGVGLLLSAAVVNFPDILDIYQIFLVLWLYLSAIFYPYETIPAAYRWAFFNFNPMYHLMLLFRDPIYYGNWPSWSHILAATVIAVGALLLGWVGFTRRADELVYRI